MRSIPEKTLEHWASMYATYRYRSHAGLWWPAHGEDVAVTGLPGRGAGKIFNLEIKTTEASTSGHQHSGHVRVAQLLRYLSLPVPTYYAFPLPGWIGPIQEPAAAAWLGGTSRTELGFTRPGSPRPRGQWFGDWMVVVPDVALYAPIAATYPLGSSVAYNVSEELFKVDISGTVTMGAAYTSLSLVGGPGRASGLSSPFMRWRNFWDRMDRCGGPGALPALFVVPGGADTSTSRSQLVDKLVAAAETSPDDSGELAFYAPANRIEEPNAQQLYSRIGFEERALARERDSEEGDVDDRLTSVFVSARAVAAARAEAQTPGGEP